MQHATRAAPIAFPDDVLTGSAPHLDRAFGAKPAQPNDSKLCSSGWAGGRRNHSQNLFFAMKTASSAAALQMQPLSKLSVISLRSLYKASLLPIGDDC
jgi:hypothetical protein